MFPAGNNRANIGIGLSKNDAKKEDRTLSKIMEEVTNLNILRVDFPMQGHSKNQKDGIFQWEAFIEKTMEMVLCFSEMLQD